MNRRWPTCAGAPAAARRALDSIYNGADDDGSGSMGVLEIARVPRVAHRGRSARMLFVWHVGEEEGLFGSEYFTDHPTVPRDSIVAQLNMDMIGRGGAADVTGNNKDGGKLRGGPATCSSSARAGCPRELGEPGRDGEPHRQATASRFDYSMDANGHPQNIYCRSDHYEYARYGIPIIFFTTGGHADYHQVTDEPQYIDYDRAAQVSGLVADLAPAGGRPRPPPRGRPAQARSERPLRAVTRHPERGRRMERGRANARPRLLFSYRRCD